MGRQVSSMATNRGPKLRENQRQKAYLRTHPGVAVAQLSATSKIEAGMTQTGLKIMISTVIGALVAAALPAFAQTKEELAMKACEKARPSYQSWLDGVRKEALENKISMATWEAALPEMTYSPAIIQRDRSQGGFYYPFLKFYEARAHTRLGIARKKLKQYSDLLNQVTAKYGVPGEIILAFWGMETDFAVAPRVDASGADKLFPVLTSMATLAYDCRRPDLFRKNLLDALRLVENRDVNVGDLRGEWAGEMSGLQFTPSVFWKYGVDFDGDRRRDPVHSVSDLIATAANVLKDYGWQANEPYLQEVRVPDNMAWEQADLTTKIQQPRSYWARAGVTTPDGRPVINDGKMASLMLPMGRLGPAFLAYTNFRSLLTWNNSLNNALTAGYLASRIRDEKLQPLSPGKAVVEVLTKEQLMRLQVALQKRGYEMGKIDGVLGTGTRVGIKEMQLKNGLPADAYPTLELLDILERQR